MKKNLLLMGKIVSTHGIAGNILIKSFTFPSINIINMKLVEEKEQKLILKFIRQNSQGHLICKANEINNRTEAEKLKGLKLFCYKPDLPLLVEDEFYIEDLKELTVVDHKLTPIGKIINISNFGAGDIIEIEFINNKKVELFPFNKQFFPVITNEYIILKL